MQRFFFKKKEQTTKADFNLLLLSLVLVQSQSDVNILRSYRKIPRVGQSASKSAKQLGRVAVDIWRNGLSTPTIRLKAPRIKGPTTIRRVWASLLGLDVPTGKSDVKRL